MLKAIFSKISKKIKEILIFLSSDNFKQNEEIL